MSQDHFPTESGSSAWGGHGEPSETHSSQLPPQYMTVGNGTAPAAAHALMASLNQDSGYGNSIAGDTEVESHFDAEWRTGLMEDRQITLATTAIPGEDSTVDREKQIIASHVHQLLYNSNRMKLGRAITRTVEILKDLQEMNRKWPAHYPSFQNNSASPPQRPALHQAQSTHGTEDGRDICRPVKLRRAMTSFRDDHPGESSAAAECRGSPEPRLMTPSIAHEFSILKLDLKLGALSQAELVHSLEKASIASLLDGKINQSIKHLLLLRDRIEDTSSKVLVTGDLNAGKSTFCNALLRRKVLPEDQQPCTSIFCEVLDARENGGLEEVHAVHKDQLYNRNDESTYDVYTLAELEVIVVDNSRYMQCKVYVKDVRTIDESLLNNGVVDIALIDAPGLNSDSLKTTAIFARQEEIDVVVFVVSAANHFTLSAKEFILNAAHEKAYIFMVVNGFDNIRDKERCQRMVLEQIAKLSPRTFKESAELVHFVSSNVIPVVSSLPGSSGTGENGPDPPDDSSDDEKNLEIKKAKEPKKDKGKGREKIQDFENLESALRKFVLEKRARSKLAPARTYLLNMFSDLNILASVNRDVAQSELKRFTEELNELEPAYEDGKKKKIELAEQIELAIDESCGNVYDHTRSTLNNTIARVAQADLGVEYPGLFSAFQFAEDLKLAMLDQISESVSTCEVYARTKTVQGVNFIQNLGLLHASEDKFSALNFRADNMFRKRRDAMARQVNTEIELVDFFDISGFWERQEKVASTGMAMTIVTVLGGKAIGGIGWTDGVFGAARIIRYSNLRRMVLPGIVAIAILTAAYMLSSIPNTLPSRLARKLSAKLAEIDYTHSNAARISSEVRRVLNVPASNLQTSLAQGIEDIARRKDEVSNVKRESEDARKYFANLFRESQESRRTIEEVDLEAPLPGGLGI